MKVFFEKTELIADTCSLMEPGNHSKNGASLKSLISKGNLWIVSCFFLLFIAMGACKNGEDDDKYYTLPSPTGVAIEKVKDSIRISWNPVEEAEYYRVCVEMIDSYRHREDWHDCYDCSLVYIPDYPVDSCAATVYSYKAGQYYSSGKSNTVSCAYKPTGGGTKTGLYLGIISFNKGIGVSKINLLTDYENVNDTYHYLTFLANMKMMDNTGLYYAVDNAIKQLEVVMLPEDLTKVSIVTFTDGLDNASIDLNKNINYQSPDDYRDAIGISIANTQIKGLNIDAYSIGIRGGDIDDIEGFKAGLFAMASCPDNVYEVSNMDEVNETFEKLANLLYNENDRTTLKLKIAGGIADGTKMRFTFDNVVSASASKCYIEGIYRRKGDSRVLEDIVYYGVNSSSGSVIVGDRLDDVDVVYTFKDFKKNPSYGISNIKQWKYVSNSDFWQQDSEFGNEGDIVPIVEKSSAVVLLVLDCTTSLGDNGFHQMKNAATSFIELLAGKN
ncbi:MAG: hypothetical protein K2O69_03300 [Odoribacter sp.]|nr:hypothetical protein [Odoribacter sp.]